MFSVLIGKRVVAQTPRRFGVNVEVQEHYDRCNLWDWLADSGATVIREFHPEKYLRKERLTCEQLSGISSKADFDQWRQQLAAHPESLPWHLFLFNEPVKWLGVPDGIIGKVKQGGMEPIVSMGYYPRMFSEPLLRFLSPDELAPHAASYGEMKTPSPLVPGVWEQMPGDQDINWRAAAAAYEYYFAFLYHYANDFSVRYFNLHNEPEFYYRSFHFPPELMPDPPKYYQPYGAYGTSRYLVPMAMQMAVLSRIARIACEDVQTGLKDPELARDLTLASPAWGGNSEYYWSLAHPFVDIEDYHCYTTNPGAFAQFHHRVSMTVAQTPGKKTACTEYGRKGGPVRVSDLLFDIGPALEAAGLMLTTLSFTRPEDPPCEFVTFYHFQFPATHRNYKNLVYGDMNSLDWSGQDKPLNLRGDRRYPSFAQLQLRYPTTAYHMFRMLARCAPGPGAPVAAYPVLEAGLLNCARPEYAGLRTLVVDTGRDLIVTFHNAALQKAPDVELDLSRFAGRFSFAVVRETSRTTCDEVVAQVRLEQDRMRLDVAAQSLTQIILTPLALDRISSLRLTETTLTPGNAQCLAQYQTTRFQALGRIDDRDHDLSQMNVLWRSSDGEAVPVYQGGLVVCLLPGPGTVTVQAATMDGAIRAAADIQTI